MASCATHTLTRRPLPTRSGAARAQPPALPRAAAPRAAGASSPRAGGSSGRGSSWGPCPRPSSAVLAARFGCDPRGPCDPAVRSLAAVAPEGSASRTARPRRQSSPPPSSRSTRSATGRCVAHSSRRGTRRGSWRPATAGSRPAAGQRGSCCLRVVDQACCPAHCPAALALPGPRSSALRPPPCRPASSGTRRQACRPGRSDVTVPRARCDETINFALRASSSPPRTRLAAVV